MADKEADDEVLESESEVQEGAGQPTPLPSIPSIDEQPSAQSPSLGSFVDALSDPRTKAAVVDLLRPEWQKDDQSIKDVRLDSQGKSIDSLTSDVERLKSYIQATGGDVDRAVREMRIDDVLEGRTSAPASGLVDDGNESQKKFATAKTQLALDDAGIAYDDPAYLLLVSQYGTLPADQWINVAETWAGQQKDKRAKQENIPGAAAASEGGKTVPAVDEEQDGLLGELNDFYAGKYGSLTKPENSKRMKEIAETLNKIEPASGPTREMAGFVPLTPEQIKAQQ